LRIANISFVMFVFPFVRPHGITDFPLDGFSCCHIRIFLLSVEKIQVSLKSYRNNGYFTWRPVHGCDISLNYSWSEKCFRQKLRWKSKHLFNNVFATILLFVGQCENTVDPDMTQPTTWRMRFALRQEYRQINIIFNTCCLSTATIAMRKRRSITLYVHSQRCFILMMSRNVNLEALKKERFHLFVWKAFSISMNEFH
jgi:hypothetical protein